MISEGSCETKDWSKMLKIQLCITGQFTFYIGLGDNSIMIIIAK